MPAEPQEAARTAPVRRWLVSAVRTAAQPQPALPFHRQNRVRPASLDAADSAGSAPVTSH